MTIYNNKSERDKIKKRWIQQTAENISKLEVISIICATRCVTSEKKMELVAGVCMRAGTIR